MTAIRRKSSITVAEVRLMILVHNPDHRADHVESISEVSAPFLANSVDYISCVSVVLSCPVHMSLSNLDQ